MLSFRVLLTTATYFSSFGSGLSYRILPNRGKLISGSKQKSQTQLKVSISEVLFNGECLWRTCSDNILSTDGLAHDAIVMASMNAVSDIAAQLLSKKTTKDLTKESYDFKRTERFALFGLADGMVSHFWVYSLAVFVHGNSLTDIVTSVFADNLLYTPIWCVWFIAAMAVLENKSMSNFVNTFKSEWQSLFLLSLGFYFPLACVIYSFVHLENRVLAFALGSLLYTILLSLWSTDENRSRDPSNINSLSNSHSNTHGLEEYMGSMSSSTMGLGSGSGGLELELELEMEIDGEGVGLFADDSTSINYDDSFIENATTTTAYNIRHYPYD
eukprot:gene8695-17957_t